MHAALGFFRAVVEVICRRAFKYDSQIRLDLCRGNGRTSHANLFLGGKSAYYLYCQVILYCLQCS